ncbi:Hypothetical predicted protein, partial [Marmota monax]
SEGLATGARRTRVLRLREEVSRARLQSAAPPGSRDRTWSAALRFAPGENSRRSAYGRQRAASAGDQAGARGFGAGQGWGRLLLSLEIRKVCGGTRA